MKKILNSYLERVEWHLKPMPVSERVDIVKEIKSEMLELENEGKTPEEIINRLGNPKKLAKAYLEAFIAKDNTFSFTRVLAMIAYYSLASLSGIFIIPILIICGPVFIICGAVCPVLGLYKMIDLLLNLGLPYGDTIVVAGIENPFIVLVICVTMGLALLFAGYACWKLLLCYFKALNKTKELMKI